MNALPLRIRMTVLTVGVAASAMALLVVSGGISDIEESVAIDTLESSATALEQTESSLARYASDLRGWLAEADGGPIEDWADLPGLRRLFFDPQGRAVAFEPGGPLTFTETLSCRASPTAVACESDTTASDPRLPDWAAELVVDRAEQVAAVPIVVLGFVATDPAGTATLIRLETDIFAAGESGLGSGVGDIVLWALPALLLVLGLVTWFLLGRVLHPVEAMRVQVDQIGAGSLDQRVPVPAADDELRQLAETMNRMLDRLERASSTQRRFIADASHELRSPIAATGATLELANADPSRADWPHVAAVIEEENTRLALLVDDLLALAQMDEEAQSGRRGRRTAVDLDEICLTEGERSRPVEVSVHVAVPARVTGDLMALTRAIRNLVDNAAAHATSAVQVEVDADGSDAVVRVSDDGPGVPHEFADTIFERFFRVDESRARCGGGGGGLGLAIARQVAENHGGTLVLLAVAAQRPQGATFELRLPGE